VDELIEDQLGVTMAVVECGVESRTIDLNSLCVVPTLVEQQQQQQEAPAEPSPNPTDVTRSLFPGADEGSIASGLEDDAAEKGDEREAGEQSFDGDEDAADLGPRDADDVAHDVDDDAGDDVAHDGDDDRGASGIDIDSVMDFEQRADWLRRAKHLCVSLHDDPLMVAICQHRAFRPFLKGKGLLHMDNQGLRVLLGCACAANLLVKLDIVPKEWEDDNWTQIVASQRKLLGWYRCLNRRLASEYDGIKSGKAVLTQLQPPCDAVVDSQEMVVVAVWRHQKRHIVGLQEEEGGRNQWRRVSPLPHLGKLTRIRPSVQRPAAVQAAEAFRQCFQSKGPDCNPVWAPGAEDKAPRNNVPKKPAKRTTTPGAVNTDLRNSQKKPRLNDEEVVGQPVTASFDTDALAAAVYKTLCAKPPPAWYCKC
jgi:hypothetical protein